MSSGERNKPNQSPKSKKIWPPVFLLSSVLVSVWLSLLPGSGCNTWANAKITFCGYDIYGYIEALLPILALLILVCSFVKSLKLIHGTGKNSILSAVLVFIGIGILLFGYFISANTFIRCKNTEAAVKAMLASLYAPATMYTDDHGHYPKNNEEMISNGELVGERMIGQYNIAVIDDGNPKTFSAEAKLYGTEKRYPCEDERKLLKTVRYYCDENNTCNFEIK